MSNWYNFADPNVLNTIIEVKAETVQAFQISSINIGSTSLLSCMK